MNYAVILAGGAGTRFWPFSRELEPKQFMHVLGGNSLLQSTIERIKGVIPHRQIYIITNQNYFFEVKDQLKEYGIPDENIILEPTGKNTAPAVGLCARLISKFDPEGVMLVLPSDHYIKNAKNFNGCLKKAILCAGKNYLVTIGIRPDSPSTGYGYIKAKNNLKMTGVLGVEKFLEKPSLIMAKKYLKDKRFYWNSGMFIWKASVLLDETKKFLPDLYKQLELIETKADIGKVWPKIKPISVDYGIMERSKRIVLIPSDFYWTDLGSWDALGSLLPKDKKGNILNDNCIDLESNGVCVLTRGKRLVSTIGLKDIIIADTPDALLVCDKNKTQDVRKVVQCLRDAHRREHISHLTEKRPWGSFTTLQSDLGFKIKLLEIDPHKRMSLQRHNRRAEHWVVVSGTAKVTSGKKVKFVHSNNSVYVPKKTKHRLENPGELPLMIVEVQTGDYLEDDDIERFSDDYQRAGR